MVTIIDDKSRTIFYHVPKCGGMSISGQLENELLCDPRFGQSGITKHPELGDVMMCHLPAPVIRMHFSEVFSKLQSYRTFGIWRDPERRFYSAFSQHVAEFHRLNIYSAPDAKIAELLDRVLNSIGPGQPGMLNEFIHFNLQADYIECDGERIIDSLYALSDIEIATAEMSRAFNVPLEGSARENVRSKGYRSDKIRKIMPKLAATARSLLPEAATSAIKGTLIPRLQTEKAPAMPEALRAPSVAEFVRTFYARDYALEPKEVATA